MPEALARWRAFVHPGQLVPESTCPLCGEPSAPMWPTGDLRRCAALLVDLCRTHREQVQVEVLRRDLDVRAALALVRSRARPVAPRRSQRHVCGVCGRAGHNRRRRPAQEGRG